jgi:23S rRNA (guanosine2251-2'-O)-methyltransferase
VNKIGSQLTGTIYGKYPVFLALRRRPGSFVDIYTSNLRELVAFLKAEDINMEHSTIRQASNGELSKMLWDKNANHQGYVAHLKEDRKVDFDDFLEKKCGGTTERPKLLILDELTDPHNVGAIVRTAVAFGVDHLIKTRYNSPKDMAVISKTSAGTSEFVNIMEVININRAIEILKKSGYYVVGLCGRSKKNLRDVRDMANLCLVIGSEGKGLRRLVRKNCDILCSIKMKNEAVESLNASVAAALAIYELWS